jgi:hypothetical protein
MWTGHRVFLRRDPSPTDSRGKSLIHPGCSYLLLAVSLVRAYEDSVNKERHPLPVKVKGVFWFEREPPPDNPEFKFSFNGTP